MKSCQNVAEVGVYFDSQRISTISESLHCSSPLTMEFRTTTVEVFS